MRVEVEVVGREKDVLTFIWDVQVEVQTVFTLAAKTRQVTLQGLQPPARHTGEGCCLVRYVGQPLGAGRAEVQRLVHAHPL